MAKRADIAAAIKDQFGQPDDFVDDLLSLAQNYNSYKNDILLGGAGADVLDGGVGSYVLLAGSANLSLADLERAGNEWRRIDVTYSQRVSNLRNGGGVNGAARLNSSTVTQDADADSLAGGSDAAWFWADVSAPGVDTPTDRVSG